MANKKLSNDLKTSLEAIRHINWSDGTHKLPNNVNKKLLDQCSDIIKEFIESEELLPKKKKTKTIKPQQKRQVTKPKIKVTKTKQIKSNRISQKIKSKAKPLKKNIHYANMSSTNSYPCYPSAFPCFRSCGPINCPENKLPMPRDLWYRIVYSQALEQQFGSGESSISQNRSVSRLPSSSKRKHKEDESLFDKSSNNNLHKNKSNSTNQLRQQTMNAVLSSTSSKLIKLDVMNDHLHKSDTEIDVLNLSTRKFDILEWNQEISPSIPLNSYKPFPIDNLEYVAETLPLEIEIEHIESKDLAHQKQIESKENLETKNSHQNKVWNTNTDAKISFTQSAHAELINRPKIHRGLSADATLERIPPTPSAPSAPIVFNFEETIASPIHSDEHEKSIISIQPLIKPNSSVIEEHPLFNQLFEYYSLEDIPRLQLFKRLNRRLIHIRQTLNMMSLNNIEIKLKYKRDGKYTEFCRLLNPIEKLALVKKRQTPVQSLTKDERIAMVELELNVYEYVRVLDEPSSKCFRVDYNDELETDRSSPALILPLHDTVSPVLKSAIASESSIAPSVSTFNTVRPSVVSQSTALLSTTTHLSERTEKFLSWNHPLLSYLMNKFDQSTSLRRSQIHKQLARRCEHICKKAKELSEMELQAQIDSKTKALQQSKTIVQPSEDERLRIAELELCLFELEKEQTQRNQFE